MDQSCRSACQLNVSTSDEQLILGVGALLNQSTRQHVHRSHHLFAQEVSNLNGLATVGNVHVDGKVGINQAKFVLELFGNTVEKVGDVAANGVQHRALLALGKVHPGHHLLATIGQKEFNGQMLEVSLQAPVLAGDLPS